MLRVSTVIFRKPLRSQFALDPKHATQVSIVLPTQAATSVRPVLVAAGAPENKAFWKANKGPDAPGSLSWKECVRRGAGHHPEAGRPI